MDSEPSREKVCGYFWQMHTKRPPEISCLQTQTQRDLLLLPLKRKPDDTDLLFLLRVEMMVFLSSNQTILNVDGIPNLRNQTATAAPPMVKMKVFESTTGTQHSWSSPPLLAAATSLGCVWSKTLFVTNTSIFVSFCKQCTALWDPSNPILSLLAYDTISIFDVSKVKHQIEKSSIILMTGPHTSADAPLVPLA